MAGSPSFSIGLDLGTTNCALAFVALTEAGGVSQVFPIPQRDGWRTQVEQPVLPSFLHRLTPGQRALLEEGGQPLADGDWVPGELAFRQLAVTPGRVVHSAKSWLASQALHPETLRLPWHSTELPDDEKISPLEASSRLLAALRRAWDERYGIARPEWRFEAQLVTITVPASFDAGAQRATHQAALSAGFPDTVRLLEEPQAAFNRYLEARAAGSVATRGWPAGSIILVVDVGGGTSDFCLFRALDGAGHGQPRLERVAVSDHLLLGGDNIDLALAHFLEGLLPLDGREVEGEPWNHLVVKARQLKERCLSPQTPLDQTLPFAIPGRGAGLLSGLLAGETTVGVLREIVLEGFFPFCARGAQPIPGQSALQEWGLPYATDFAVTRYLADFLRGHPPVEAVLFNGGMLASPVLQERLLDQIGRWQEGRRPALLDNPETSLAVARGAAYDGALLARRQRRIESGAARAVFLEVDGASTGQPTRMVCVLPRGAPAGHACTASPVGLHLRVGRKVRLQAWQGAHRRDDAPGAIDVWQPGHFTGLPALETVLHRPLDWPAVDQDGAGETIPVQLESQLNELGLLQVEAVSADSQRPGRWPLSFNLRTAESPQTSPTTITEEPDRGLEPPALGLPTERLAAGVQAWQRLLAPRRLRKGDRLTPTQALNRLEAVFGQPKQDWALPIVRRLADALLEQPPAADRPHGARETWSYLVGFLLRPGFGEAGDPARLDRLWDLAGPHFASDQRPADAWLVLWRRLAGGLSPDRQAAIAHRLMPAVWEDRRPSPEAVRLAGALERLPLVTKEETARHFWRRTRQELTGSGYPVPFLSALGMILNRVPFHAGLEWITPPELVEVAFAELKTNPWQEPLVMDWTALFLRAARRVGTESLNVPPKTGRQIADRLHQAGVPEARLAPLRQCVPLERSERLSAYGESLPPGLILA